MNSGKQYLPEGFYQGIFNIWLNNQASSNKLSEVLQLNEKIISFDPKPSGRRELSSKFSFNADTLIETESFFTAVEHKTNRITRLEDSQKVLYVNQFLINYLSNPTPEKKLKIEKKWKFIFTGQTPYYPELHRQYEVSKSGKKTSTFHIEFISKKEHQDDMEYRFRCVYYKGRHEEFLREIVDEKKEFIIYYSHCPWDGLINQMTEHLNFDAKTFQQLLLANLGL